MVNPKLPTRPAVRLWRTGKCSGKVRQPTRAHPGGPPASPCRHGAPAEFFLPDTPHVLRTPNTGENSTETPPFPAHFIADAVETAGGGERLSYRLGRSTHSGYEPTSTRMEFSPSQSASSLRSNSASSLTHVFEAMTIATPLTKTSYG